MRLTRTIRRASVFACCLLAGPRSSATESCVSIVFPALAVLSDRPAGIVVAADIDGDGWPDLVAGDPAMGISVLLSRGSRQFSDPISIPIQNLTLRSLAVGDFDGDGHPDLAIVNSEGNDVLILFGDGSGNFRMSSALGLFDAIAVISSDFDRDGIQDLLALHGSGVVSIHFGDGSGHFRTPVNVMLGSVGFVVPTFTIADVNGDGIPDIVGAVSVPGTGPVRGKVTVLLGDGRGGILGSPIDTEIDEEPVFLTGADLNGDGRQDIVAADYGFGHALVLLSDGTGRFSVAQRLQAGDHPISLAIADLDGDGQLDLAVVNVFSSDLTIFRGDGKGTFDEGRTLIGPAAPSSIVAVDFEGRGIKDLVVGGSAGVCLYRGRGEGQFDRARRGPAERARFG